MNNKFYKRVGTQVRNYLKGEHPEIDEEIKGCSDLEDGIWRVINEIMTDYDSGRETTGSCE